MKKSIAIIAILTLVNLALVAQSAINGQITLKPIGAASACTVDSTGDTICAASDGIYVSIAGGPFTKLATGSVGSGVLTFNGRTGTVTPSAGDYTYAQLASPPTTISCPTASLSTAGTGAFTATSCVIK